MSVDLSTLVLRVDGEQGTRTIQKYDAAAQKADRSSRLLDEATAKLGKAFAALGGIAAASKLIDIADTYTLINGRLRLVTSGTADLARVQSQLFAVAQQTRQSFEGTADLYTRLARASGALGLSQDQLLQFTQQVGQALVVSGTSSAQASGALTQLSQALGGGVVRAEEFNSVLEGAPRIIQAVAGSLGLTIGQLRTLVNSGELSSKQFADAFLRAGAQINSEFGQLPTTVGQSLTLLNNALGKLVSSSNDATGATGLLAGGIAGAATVITEYGDAIQALIIALGTAGLIRALSAAAAGFTTLGATAGAAWALVTGPIGLTIAGVAAVAAGVYLLIRAFKDQAPAVDKAAEALARQKKAADEAYAAARQLSSATWVAPDMIGKLTELSVQLDALRRGGKPLADATKLASDEWARSSKSSKSFAVALAEGDSKAQNYLRTAQATVKVQADIDRATKTATKSQQDATRAAEERRQIEADYQAQVVQLGLELAERARVADEQRTAALTATDTALRQLAVSQTAKNDALTAEIAALAGGIDATRAYARQQQIVALATERMNEARAAGIPLTQQYLVLLLAEAANTQRLLDTRKTLEQINGTDLKTLFAIPDDTPKTVRELDSALQSVSGTLRDVSQALNGTGNDAVKMLGVLASALDGLARAQKRAEEMRKAGVTMSGGQKLATAVGGAVGSFGAGYAVGSTTSSRTAGAIGGALAGAASGAATGAALGAAGGPLAVITAPVGAVLGTLIGGIGGLLAASKNATQELIAQKAAQQQLNEALASLRASFGNDALGGAIAQARAQFSQLRQQTEAAFAGRKNEAERGRVLAELNTLEARRLELIRAEFAESQRRLQEDAKVRTLRANGFIAEAEALAFSAEQERKLADLRKSGADAATIAAEQEALLAEARQRQAEIAEAERRTLFDLTNGTRGFTDPRGASQAAFDEAQQRRYTDAVTRGASAAELAAIELFNLAEAADRARQIQEQDTRTRESLTVRGLSALGLTREAEDASLAASQRQEIADAIRDGMSPSNLALLKFVQFVEREELAMRRAIEEGTQRITDAAEKQIKAIDEQIAFEQERAKQEIAAIDAQIQLIRETTAIATAQIDNEILRIEGALEAQVEVIDAQLETLNAMLRVQQAQLQAAESSLQVARAAYDALTEFGRSLLQTETAGTTPLLRLAAADARFEELRRLAGTGDATAAQALPDAARALLDASKEVNASGTGFQRDFARVQEAVASLGALFGGDVERLTPQVEALRALVASTEQQIETLETLKETLQETAAAQIAVLREQKQAIEDEAAKQIEKLELNKEAIKFAADVIVEALRAQKEQVQVDAQRQIDQLVKLETESFKARVEASDYYAQWKELTTEQGDSASAYHETSTSLLAAVEERAQETNTELRAQSASLTSLVESQAAQIAALQAQVRTSSAIGSATIAELGAIRFELANAAAASRRAAEGAGL